MHSLVLPAQFEVQNSLKAICTRQPISPSQANHLGVTIQADIIKQKLPERNGGYKSVEAALGGSYGKTTSSFTRSSPPTIRSIWSVSGGELLHGPLRFDQFGWRVEGRERLAEAVRTAVINKRGGGMGLISGRKAFQRPMSEGVQLLNAIQDVYLADEITVA